MKEDEKVKIDILEQADARELLRFSVQICRDKHFTTSEEYVKIKQYLKRKGLKIIW